mmetsp:Transcript_89874/g.262694  ORF Transcript_89874/g.262694 Transcript_89874/m.262694 type:complete len:103 (+) Transcript_89874:178-486(+)
MRSTGLASTSSHGLVGLRAGSLLLGSVLPRLLTGDESRWDAMAAMASAMSEGEGGADSLANVRNSSSVSGEGGATGVMGTARLATALPGPGCGVVEGSAGGW